VGDVANKNFQQLGHAVVHFDGKISAGLPGEIHVEDLEIAEIAIGTPVVFRKN
jgi:sorbitol-specific phosphotransferase system component IIA